MADFASNVKVLAIAMGVPHPLREDDLGIARLLFNNCDNTTRALDVSSTSKNMGSRLFVEALARAATLGGCPQNLSELERFQAAAEEFFAEYWGDRPGTGIHPIIDGLRSAKSVTIAWKSAETKSSLRLTFTNLLGRMCEWRRSQTSNRKPTTTD